MSVLSSCCSVPCRPGTLSGALQRSPCASYSSFSSSLAFAFPLKNRNSLLRVSRLPASVVADPSHRQIRCSSVKNSSGISSAGVLIDWLKENAFPEQPLTVGDAPPKGLGCFAKRDIKKGEVILRIPENFCVTRIDVARIPKLASAINDKDDLVSLTLWLIHERSLGESSLWYNYVRVFPDQVHLSPINWDSEQLKTLLKGSPVLLETEERIRAIEKVFSDLKSKVFDADLQNFPSDVYNLENFKRAFSIILSRVVFLPAANSFALIPFADFLNHSDNANTFLDYFPESQAVILNASKDYKAGEEVYTSYTFNSDRTYTDLFINYGIVDESAKNNFLNFQASLVTTDRLFSLKSQLLAEVGFQPQQNFPIFEDRFPTQMLTFVRLARLTDPALFAKISFERDSKIDDANEYEVLMLLISECRDRLSAYSSGLEEDLALLGKKNLNEKERLSAQLRVMEKRIISNTMNALRKRLAPIRGIPSKGGGLQDPNSDIKEMFQIMEEGLSAPRKLLSSFFNKKQ